MSIRRTNRSRLIQCRDRGAVIPLIALALPVLILMTAFAIDLGQQRASRRTMQARADVIALDMARLADGRTVGEILADPQTEIELQASADRNEVDRPKIVEVVWGRYDATVQPLPIVEFHQPDAAPADPSLVPDAVRITTSETTDYRFQPGSGSVTRNAVGTIGDDPEAEFLLGSTLVSMTPNSNWIVGRVLQQIIPNADLVGYQGLANANVTLRSLAAGLNLGSPDELANATVTFRQLLVASAAALQADDGSADDKAAAVQVMNDLLALDVGDFDVAMGDVLGLGTTDGDGLDGSVSIPQLLVSAVSVANGINAISVPDTVLNVAGLASVTLDLSAIKPPIRIGKVEGSSGSTDQLDLGVTIDVDLSGDKNQRLCDLPPDERTFLGQLLGGIFQVLNCLLAPLTQAVLDVKVNGTVDLDLTLGTVTGTQSIDCGASRLNIGYDRDPVDIAVNANLTTTATFDGKDLTLLGIAPVTNTVQAAGSAGSVSFQPTDVGPRHLAFEQVFPDDSTGGPTARVGAPNLGLPSLLNTSGIQVTVVNANLPVLGGIARNLVVPVLNNIIDEVDKQLVAEVSRLLGLNLGGADITPQFMECNDNGVRLVG